MAKIPIWVKTPKGVEEIEKRTLRLSVRARRVLILIDGKRDFATLSSLVPSETLPEICRQLLNDGYIAAVHPPGSAIGASEKAPTDTARPALSIVEQQRLSMARNFMTNTLTMYVGHAASSLINHVEAAHDLAHLRGLAKQWREAIALSADGRKQLADLSSRLVVIDQHFLAALANAKVADVRPPPKTPAATSPPTPADDGEHLTMARNFMLNTLDTFVGLAASSLVSRIENCPDKRGLRTLFDEWRDAIALSRDGRKRLRELDSQLAALLA
ncbi:MAG TPA: hypothetical protein PLS67_03020 [Accumulibacter sp.]|jgi:hypothetical protein|nr:hypothetical protein [Accumulibacter sp.]HQC79481.1 hypothetical protein [Accumulibacter sp.]